MRTVVSDHEMRRVRITLGLIFFGFIVIGAAFIRAISEQRELTEQASQAVEAVEELADTALPDLLTYEVDPIPAEAAGRFGFLLEGTPCFAQTVEVADMTVDARIVFAADDPPDWASLGAYEFEPSTARFGGDGRPLDEQNCSQPSGLFVRQFPDAFTDDLAANPGVTPEIVIRYRLGVIDVSDPVNPVIGQDVLVSTTPFTVPLGTGRKVETP